MDLLKRASPYFSMVFCPGTVLVNPFLRFTKTADFLTKILGFQGNQGVTNVHLSNVRFVLRDIFALLDHFWGS